MTGRNCAENAPAHLPSTTPGARSGAPHPKAPLTCPGAMPGAARRTPESNCAGVRTFRYGAAPDQPGAGLPRASCIACHDEMPAHVHDVHRALCHP